MIRIGINGFGRIGRIIFRAALQRKDVEFVGINDLTDAATICHLLKYDSVHGRLGASVELQGNSLVVDGRKSLLFSESDPTKLPWGKIGADIVIESTGRFTSRADGTKHLNSGAKKVIISAPSKDADATLCMGVNQQAYAPKDHHVISNASCTTNCLAPVAKVLNEKFELQKGLMTTIHSYTNDQNLLDFPHKDLRRARAGALSMIPTSTGAAKAVGLVLPELNGKLDGFAIRVPTPNVSCVDLVALLGKPTDAKAVNQALKEASEGAMKGILGFCEEPLVSVDFNSTPLSSIVDAPSTKVLEGNLVKVLAWYDNEMGYSTRCLDLAAYLNERL